MKGAFCPICITSEWYSSACTGQRLSWSCGLRRDLQLKRVQRTGSSERANDTHAAAAAE